MAHDYDVAISFLARDEPLALRLRDRLTPLRVFVYSKQQEELAGRQGDESFGEIFRDKSLLSVVLFRPQWGQTPWTRVEETAIRDCIFHEGVERLLFVHLEKAETPKWVPRRYLYLDYQSFGIDELIGAIKARCVDLGVDVRPPSAVERAAQMAAKEKFDSETEALTRTSAERSCTPQLTLEGAKV